MKNYITWKMAAIASSDIHINPLMLLGIEVPRNSIRDPRDRFVMNNIDYSTTSVADVFWNWDISGEISQLNKH